MTDPFGGLTRFLREARRRHVFRVALVYTAVAFVVLQVAELLVPLLYLPEWLGRLVFFVLLIGFPLALLFAWAYELTPDGPRRELEGSATERSATGETAAASAAPKEARLSGSTLVVTISLAMVGLLVWWWTPTLLSSASRTNGTPASGAFVDNQLSSPLRLAITPPPGTRLSPDPADVAISPDGEVIVFAAFGSDTAQDPQLYQRSIHEYGAHPIPGAVGSQPFFSPDGRWISYEHEDRLWKVSLIAGEPQPLADVVTWFGGGDWGEDGTIVYADGQLGLYRIHSSGGTPEQLFPVRRGGENYQHPRWLVPDERLLFTSRRPGGRKRIMLLDLQSGEPSVLVEQGYNARYLPGHELLFYRLDGSLLAARSDLGGEESGVVGSPTPVLRDVFRDARGEGVALSPNGTLVYLAVSGGRSKARLVWADTAGGVDPLALRGQDPYRYSGFRISPEGDRILFHGADPNEEQVDIWLFEPGSGHLRQVTREQGDNWWPIWSPDGTSVYHNSNRAAPEAPGSALALYVTPLGSGEPRQVAETSASIQPQSWTPDGKMLAFLDNTIDDGIEGENTLRDIWFLDFTEEPPVRRPFLRTRYDETHPSFSPDGRWIAYVSDRSGQREVYVSGYPDGGTPLRISTGGGTGPIWVPDASGLYFRSLDGSRVYRVSIGQRLEAGEPVPTADEPRLLFEGSFSGERPWGRMYDLHPDGTRFLMRQRVEQGPEEGSMASTELRVVVGWLADVRSRLLASQ